MTMQNVHAEFNFYFSFAFYFEGKAFSALCCSGGNQ